MEKQDLILDLLEEFERRAYFQGTEEPCPKKKKYKSEKSVPVQTRFKEPLYKNYDLYETEGVDGPAKHGPGAGLYQNMNKYKSVSDFLNKKRKRNKNKYKAEISKIESLSNKFIKIALDFPIDDIINSTPILGDSGIIMNSVPIGGRLDNVLPENDLEGKSPTTLDFGRDYVEDKIPFEELSKLIDKYLSPKEGEIMGLPQGIIDLEELDSPSSENPYYGIIESGNILYPNFA